MAISANRNKSIANAFGWKLLERFGVLGIQFVLQIVLARLLDPKQYGVLSLMIVFVSLANVFIQTGFTGSLIQNKNIRVNDYSSAFWISLLISCALYIILFFLAPLIGIFYNMPDIVQPFRALSIVLIPGVLNSIQTTKVTREMKFMNVFLSNTAAIVISGIAGIILAYEGAGIWALVIQYLLNTAVASIVMLFTVYWRPRLICNVKRVKRMFKYGSKILFSNLIDTLYQNLFNLAVGKGYDPATLGYFSRGRQFPQFVINAVTGAIQSVMLPAMSAEQDSRDQVKELMRNSVMLSSYIVFPIMAGIAGESASLVRILLTDKWAPCVPYIRIFCFSLAFDPVHMCNLEAINAMGRSDITLKLQIVKKITGVMLLVFALLSFKSPIALAMTGVFSAVICFFINAYPNRKLIDYYYIDQIKDICPSLIVSLSMYGWVIWVGTWGLGAPGTLIVQTAVGLASYLLMSVMFRLRPFVLLLNIAGDILSRNNERTAGYVYRDPHYKVGYQADRS